MPSSMYDAHPESMWLLISLGLTGLLQIGQSTMLSANAVDIVGRYAIVVVDMSELAMGGQRDFGRRVRWGPLGSSQTQIFETSYSSTSHSQSPEFCRSQLNPNTGSYSLGPANILHFPNISFSAFSESHPPMSCWPTYTGKSPI